MRRRFSSSRRVEAYVNGGSSVQRAEREGDVLGGGVDSGRKRLGDFGHWMTNEGDT